MSNLVDANFQLAVEQKESLLRQLTELEKVAQELNQRMNKLECQTYEGESMGKVMKTKVEPRP